MTVFLHLTGVNNLNVHVVRIGQMANIHLHLKLHLKVLKSLHETVFTRQQFVYNSICPCSIRKQTASLCLGYVFPALPLSMLGHIICLYLYLCQAAERDWEEKRASLTQFSAQDINRLLEETQAELMKAIPDLDFAARHINKPAVPPKPQITIPITSATATSAAGTTGTTATTSTTSTTTNTTPSGDQQPGKVQLAAQKLNSMEGVGSHRGSGQFVFQI